MRNSRVHKHIFISTCTYGGGGEELEPWPPYYATCVSKFTGEKRKKKENDELLLLSFRPLITLFFSAQFAFFLFKFNRIFCWAIYLSLLYPWRHHQPVVKEMETKLPFGVLVICSADGGINGCKERKTFSRLKIFALKRFPFAKRIVMDRKWT